jgi:integrase/recombinase XerD
MTTDEPIAMATAISRHLLNLQVAGYTPATLDTRTWTLGLFRKWAAAQDISLLAQITPDLITRYQHHLSRHRKKDGEPLDLRTQRTRLAPLRTFGRWLLREKLVAANPVADLVMPRVGQPLPKAWLDAEKTERILALPKTTSAAGLRDRAILETLYSTGLRRMEIIRLAITAINFAGGTVCVRLGKGRKDRIVPIGERALFWLRKYITEGRPKLARSSDEQAPLFVTERGTPFTAKHLSALVSRYVAAAGLGITGSCHLFRHTCATLMLEHGADIRYVQEQLGHACLQTTQIYAHVSVRKLKEVHSLTHPGSALPLLPLEHVSSIRPHRAR